jgi:pyruvate dehydrogenase E1 component
MVMRANKNDDDLGGHLATFASSATLYETGFNHFWRAASESFGGDMIYYQGHGELTAKSCVLCYNYSFLLS